MPLNVPNLDDRNYDDLVTEALSLLPQHSPEWTNHNPSDPGITLIELLAYFTEMLIYRLNRVTRENKLKFLQLLRGMTPDETERLPSAPVEEVDEALRETVLALREPQRAVTCEDYEYLAKRETAGNPEGRSVARAHCFVGKNLEMPDDTSRLLDYPGHVSVVVVLGNELGSHAYTSLLDIRDRLEPMRLLTTRLHVVGPFFLHVSLGAVIQIHPDISFREVQSRAIEKLEQYFNPYPGSRPYCQGWPIGRAIHLSEIYEQLERVEGVDSVQEVRVLRIAITGETMDDERTAVGIQIGVRSTIGVDSRLGGELSTGADRLIRDALGRLIAVALKPYELVRIAVREQDLLQNSERVQAGSLQF